MCLIVQNPRSPVVWKDIPVLTPIRFTPLHLDTPASRLDAIHAANEERADAIAQMGLGVPPAILEAHAQALAREYELRLQVRGTR